MAHDINKKDLEVRKYFGTLKDERDAMWKAIYALAVKAQPTQYTAKEKAKATRFLMRIKRLVRDLVQIRKEHKDPDEEDIE